MAHHADDDRGDQGGEYDNDNDGDGLVQPSTLIWGGVAAAAAAEASDPVPELIHHGEPFTDRKSTFQAHVARVVSLAEVRGMRNALLADGKIARATHNIVAFRIELAPGVFMQDCDDDGETAAGGRLLHLLQLTHTANACVMVSRWCGVGCFFGV